MGIYAIVKRLALYPNVHEMVSIEWYYEKGDDELYELGQIIHSFIDCPFIYYETEQTLKFKKISIFAHALSGTD
ncbi:MAG: hypothetical protein MZV63_67175 [Marinilabiliales bacterium]|nr:hypothetical protein [Marinilabiliales bacterium]